MQITFHLGVHCTDEDRLVRSLLKNKGKLAAAGMAVPGPSRYRSMLREALVGLQGQPATPEGQSAMLDEMIEEEEGVTRLFLSNENFLGTPDLVLVPGQLYPKAGARVQALAAMFSDHQPAFCLGLRNPATYLPALAARLHEQGRPDALAGLDVTALRWSDLLVRLRAAMPAAPITVWCHEDSPLIWPEIVAAVSGLDPAVPVNGTYDLVAEIMSGEGMKWMVAYLNDHKPQNPGQRRRIVSAFLTKFGLTDKIQMELDLPGWTQELAEELSDEYEEDLLRIAGLPGVTFLSH